jgi:hypothetical protein
VPFLSKLDITVANRDYHHLSQNATRPPKRGPTVFLDLGLITNIWYDHSVEKPTRDNVGLPLEVLRESRERQSDTVN